jgi:hypothetical protein
MADIKRPQFHPSVLQEQESEMRRLELGEAWAKGDMERVGEVTQEMKNDDVKGIGNEHYRAQEAFGEFEAREENLNAERTPAHEPASDPAREPEQDPRQNQAHDPERHVEATPARQQEQDHPERKPVLTYADLTQEHADIVAKREQGEPGQKQLRFSEDREQDRSHNQNEERTDAKQAEREQGGEKKLSFFEDRNPAKDHGMEH